MSSPSTISTFTQQYSIYSTIVIVIMGLIGNSLIILTFTKLGRFQNNQCVFYLMVESTLDILSLIDSLIIPLLTFRYGFDIWYSSPVWCKLRVIIAQILVLVFFSTICLTALDRFLSTSYLVYLRQKSTLKLARYFVLVVVCCSLCHAITFGIFFNAKPPADCAPSYPILIRYFSYFFYPILIGLLPMVIAGSFSILAYHNVRRIIRRQIPLVRRHLDRQLTKFVLLRVSFLIVLITPFVSYRIYSLNINIDPTDSMRIAVGRLLQAIFNSISYLNYAVNFYGFYLLSPQYRRQVKYVLIKKYWQPWKRRFHSDHNRIDPLNVPPVSSVELG